MKVNIGRYPGPRSKKPRRVDVRVDPWDTWNMDETVAIIVLPLLKQLRESKHGVPYVANEDVPEELQWVGEEEALLTYHNPDRKEESDRAFEKLEARWNHVFDHIIESFEKVVDGEWEKTYYETRNYDGLDREWKHVDEGFVLFGKYFRSMWD